MNYKHLTQEERYQIHILLQAGYNQREIVDELNRHPSTLSRETKRNKSTKHYNGSKAIKYAQERRKNSGNGRQKSPRFWYKVKRLLRQYYSPEQISGTLKGAVSPEAIYQYLYRDISRFNEFKVYLRQKPKYNRRRKAKPHSDTIQIEKRSIKTRPAEVELRDKIGHWEGDTIISRRADRQL